MSNGLPSMLYSDGIRKHQQTRFGGYNHNLYAGDGELWDMKNLTGDLYPILSARRPRYLLRKLDKPNGLYARDGLFWVDGAGFYADGQLIGQVSDCKKQIAAIGSFLVILPDKLIYDRNAKDLKPMESSWTGAVTIQDGTYVEEEAVANTIRGAGVNWSSFFRVGDAVTISGCQLHPENNQTFVVREIEGEYLRFGENSFALEEEEIEAKEGEETEYRTLPDQEEAVTIARAVPDMDFICENENRLWGCKGNMIYASMPGDPLNWNVNDGLASDSYTVPVASAGSFTGCASYMGYPCFFKEDKIYKVYGDKPSNYQVMSSASLGVEAGSDGSLAIAGEVLFYLSRAGVMAYTGGIPQNAAAAFGTERYRNAVGGSDGVKFYVSMENSAGEWSIFVYDTRSNLWHREDARQVIAFGWDRELYMLDAEGNMWLAGNPRELPADRIPEELVLSMAEFGDFVEGDPNRKGVTKLQLRVELDPGAELTALIRFDSSGEWQTVATLTASEKRSHYLPIVPRRCDHFRIRLEGRGSWRLYSLVRESYSGSEK